MLTRQKVVLNLLAQAGRPLTRTVLVKLLFLLRHETGLANDPSFYDFLPYSFGPFSFLLYRELDGLLRYGYVTNEGEHLTVCGRALEFLDQSERLPASIRSAVADILARYGRMSRKALIRDVYARYPWFAINSRLPERDVVSVQRPGKASPAVYTAGYEGRSVDAFLNDFLKHGMQVVVDVRANPVSRKYGFSGRRLGEFCKKLGLEYRHAPSLGISSAARSGLNDFASFQRLLKRYEETMLPELSTEVEDVGCLMRRQPSVLVCVEKDVRCCHRSRLAHAVAQATGLEVVHL